MSTVSKLTCPECFTVLRPARPLAVGQKVKCPKCDNLFTAEAEGAEDERTVTAPAPAKKAAPAKGAPVGGVPMMGATSDSGGGKKDTEEERGSFLQLGPYDLTDIANVGGRFMILLAFTPLFACMVYSGILTFGAVKAQNLESRG